MLSSLVVLEFASVLAGPSAGMFLAELGATVIKIENPKTSGDITRSWKLPEENPQNDVSAYFSSANWGKKSVAIDISLPEGRDIAYQLIGKADIIIVSYKPGDAEKLGMDFEKVKSINPSIIYASITGYGEDVHKTAYDAVLQAESGFMSINGTPESGPLKMPVALIDVIAAHHLKEGILLALIKKMQSAEGSEVRVSLYEAAISSLANQASNYLFTGKVPGRSGSEHPNIAPYGEILETSDGSFIILAVGSDNQFKSLCSILGINHDEKFATNELRLQNRSELKQLLADSISHFNVGFLMHEFMKAGVPAGVVRDIKGALSAPEAESVLMSANGINGISQLPGKSAYKTHVDAPPYFGADTYPILKKILGLQEMELVDLQKRHIISSKNIDI